MMKKEVEFLDYNINPSTVDWDKPSSDLFYCVWKRNNYKNDDSTGATWFLQKTKDTLYLILEETRGRHSKDWNCNLDYYQKEIIDGVKVHEGLLRQFRVFRDEFLEACADVQKIRIAGYSLGGGVAQIAYWYANTLFGKKKDIKAYNFEGPRALWLSKEHKHDLDGMINVRPHNDLVVHSPSHVMIAPFFRIYVSMYPKFGISFKWTGKFEISFWKYYGKQIWIGKWWKFLPYPHIPLEILKNLDRKFDTKCKYCEY
jgi:hypothetical protein